MMTRLLATAALALSLGACSTTALKDAADVAQTALTTDETPESALPYVAMGGSADMFEIESSRLALRKAQDARLKSFAGMIIPHHQRTMAATTAAARAAGLNPPRPAMIELHRDMLARLRPLGGAEFDREYRRQQVLAHELALRLHENYAKDGDTPQLRGSASQAVPVVRMHLDQIRTIEVS